MTSYVPSVDGTQIAFDRLGRGPPVIVVSGIFCARQTTQELTEQLAQQFSGINYDRRGRGQSGDTVPYSVEREVEDLGALITEAGGTASVYGHLFGCAACPERSGRRVAHHPANTARAALRAR
jgi:hypothetical protein